MKCPMCGNDTFESGNVHGYGISNLKFKSNGSSLLARATYFGGKTTRAKRCKKCGFLAIFAK